MGVIQWPPAQPATLPGLCGSRASWMNVRVSWDASQGSLGGLFVGHQGGFGGPLEGLWGASLRPVGGASGASGGLLWPSWGGMLDRPIRTHPLVPLLGLPGALLGRKARIVGSRSPSWAPLGAILGPSWAVLRPSWPVLEPSWAVLRLSWGRLGAALGTS